MVSMVVVQDAELALHSICETAAMVAGQARQQIAELHPGPDVQHECKSHPLSLLDDNFEDICMISSSYEEDSDAALWLQVRFCSCLLDANWVICSVGMGYSCFRAFCTVG